MIDLTAVVNTLCSIWEDVAPAPSALDLITLRPESYIIEQMQQLSAGNRDRLQKYVERIANAESVFACDLTQNAEHRRRVAHHTHMATLTKNCGAWYIMSLERCF